LWYSSVFNLLELNMTNKVERVYKYQLPLLSDWISMTMPAGAEPLCVQVQDGQPCMWARVVIDRPHVTHHFRIAGTGHDLGDGVGRHIDSFQLRSGSLVFHVFAEVDA
jgi:hypothetical protein